ncbi:MAG: hypothetical protein ACOC8L_14345 [Spirochaetota bacterium]
MNSLLSTIVLAAMVQGVLLGSLFAFSRKKKGTASRVLGLLLYTLVLEATTIFLPATTIGGYSIVGYFTTPEVKLFLPLCSVPGLTCGPRQRATRTAGVRRRRALRSKLAREGSFRPPGT